MPPYAQQPIAPRTNVQPSTYQQAIINWLMAGEGNAIVDAKAGSGKTSTLCMLSELIPTQGTRAAFLAFNKSIADELKRRLPSHVQAATFHSVCNAALRRHPDCVQYANRRDWVNKNKVHAIFDTLLDKHLNADAYRRGVVTLVGLMKANAMLPTTPHADILALVERYDIEFLEDAQDGGIPQGIMLARQVLTINNADLSMIDFDDMLYLCVILNAPVMKYTHLFVDEAQDTNKVQRILMQRMLARGGRLIAVGDPNQAIYGFRGADSNAMNAITEEFACQHFPLSISYRCPASVVRLAQQLVPAIEARSSAPEGTVSKLDSFSLPQFTALDLVVCRNTAPLITLAFRFLRAHMPVKVMGRDIGEQLVALIQKMRAPDIDTLATKLDEYTTRETAKALAKRQEAKAERLNDQHDSIIAIIEGLPEDERTVYGVTAVIRRLFTDDHNGARTTLSTVHKAKGMEAHRVFILDPFLMPSKFATQPWQMQQEHNLRYVAVTRALDTLHFVNSEHIAY